MKTSRHNIFNILLIRYWLSPITFVKFLILDLGIVIRNIKYIRIPSLIFFIYQKLLGTESLEFVFTTLFIISNIREAFSTQARRVSWTPRCPPLCKRTHSRSSRSRQYTISPTPRTVSTAALRKRTMIWKLSRTPTTANRRWRLANQNRTAVKANFRRLATTRFRPPLS